MTEHDSTSAKYIYIAGPYTIGDVVQNLRTAISAANKLSAAGYVPFVPHLTHFWHFLYPHNIDFWYQYDLLWLEKCDCLIHLAGESKGADIEVHFAETHNIAVYNSIEEAINNLK